MEISREELDKRLGSNKNLINSLDLFDSPKAPARGNRQESKVEIITEKKKEFTPRLESKELRTIVGVLAETTTDKKVAEAFGITEQQVKTSRLTKDPDLKARIDNTIDCVSELALTKLMDSLGLISAESLIDSKPKDLSIIASNLAGVVNKVRKTSAEGVTTGIVFHVHAPNVKSLSAYEVVNL